MSQPVWNGDPSQAQITLANCTNSNVLYVVQMSTNLADWTTLATNFASPTNFPVTVPTTSPLGFYRAVAIPRPIPIFQAAIVAISNISISGNVVAVDSFDSSDPVYSTAGQWDITKRKADGNVATLSTVTGAMNLGNADIYGSVYTVSGTNANLPQLGPDGAVGDIGWINNNLGIEPGHWSGNFSMNIPDVPAPNTSGWSTSLPSPVSGTITLAGGDYVLTTAPTSPLNIAGPVVLWVRGSLSLNATFTFTGTNNPQLILYVGTTASSGDTLSIPGGMTINQPGFARCLQIYCLPSVSTISLSNSGFVGTLYAPEANFTVSGGGNNTLDSSGAIIVNTMKVFSHWNFHYDENLAVQGPSR